MSATSPFVDATAEYWGTSLRFNNSWVIAAFVILYYDYLLTLSVEVEHFWKTANISLVSVLFVVNRYYGLLGPLPMIAEYFFDISEHKYAVHDCCAPIYSYIYLALSLSCRKIQTYHQAFAISIQAIVALILVIRTYALYERSKKILVVLLVTHIGGALACFIAIITTKSPIHNKTTLPFRLKGCNLSLTNDQGLHLVLAWSAMLWFDTTVFLLTLARAIRMRYHVPGSLLEIFFRDGTLYYGIMAVSVFANITTFLITRTNSPLKGLDTTLCNVFSTTLTSRLILNLRDPKLRRPRHLGEDDAPCESDATSAAPMTSHMMSFVSQVEVGDGAAGGAGAQGTGAAEV